MKKAEKEEMYRQIERHGQNLVALFHLKEYASDPVKLCKKLHSLEYKVHHAAEQYCNGDITSEQWEEVSDKAEKTVLSIVGQRWKGSIVINGDPRGYALKIDDTAMRTHNFKLYQDMGGFGILAPDFTPNY